MEETDALSSINKTFESIARIIQPLHYVTPTNGKEQKALFLEGVIQEPEFKYRPLEFSTEDARSELNALHIPDVAYQKRIEHRRERLLKKLVLLESRGEREKVIPLSISIYGEPDEALQKSARKLLRDIPPRSEEKNVPAKKVRTALEETFEQYGLTAWCVEYSSKWITTAYNYERKITINEDRLFSENDIHRLPVHEVGVHVMRHENHHLQDPKLMDTIFTGEYLSTEEGLASYAEEITGTASPENMRDYAGRVLAISFVLSGISFRDSFNKLIEEGFTKDQAWQLCLRTYRAGGFTRDIAYLAGYEKIKQFVQSGGDVSLLYVGRVDVSEIALIQECLKDGRLVKPRYVPEFFKT